MTLSVLLISFLTFVQLNCENLFDCKDDSATNDKEYLPDAPRKWTSWRYWQKLNNISREIISCGESPEGTTFPHFVALCEVENDSVMHDLTRRSMLRNAGYEYLMTSSDDDRGIDVALLYDPFTFSQIHKRDIKVNLPAGERTTRDILYVSGRIITDDTLHIFVVHAPSRYGGERASIPRRMAVAQALSAVIDSIRQSSSSDNIIIAGDFNDEASDKSLKHICKNNIVNITKKARGQHGAKGTYKYQGRWQSIDHILMSKPLAGDVISSSIHDQQFLLAEDTQYGGIKPRRTYTGFQYDQDGYSDHLPLVVHFNIPQKPSSINTRKQNATLSAVGVGYSATSVNTTIFRYNSLATHGDFQYISYYDTLGYLTLGKRRLNTDHWIVRRTQYKGNVKDAHNIISMMIDGDGYLHLAFDHHGHPLRYCRSTAPFSLELGDKEPMTGIDEDNVTYPEFYRMANGDLLFVYRSGASGRGNLVLNRYDVKKRKWQRMQDILIDGENERNAYWQLYVDAQGTIHLSWVWRETWLVETNHDLCYARSTDGGKTWQKSNGEQYSLPIRKDNAEYACLIPQNSELINQTSMSADDKGNPYIATYWRDADSDIPQYRLVWNDGKQWHARQVGKRKTPFSLKGGGTKMIPISRPRLVVDNGEAWYIFRDEERGSKVSIAHTHDITSASWTIHDVTDFPVDAWEPSIDTELWKMKKRLNIFVQHTRQGDGEKTTDFSPQPVYVLEPQL